jgi:chemosensory pili system protein ChpA (sensor histidine kinase/response regulator)
MMGDRSPVLGSPHYTLTGREPEISGLRPDVLLLDDDPMLGQITEKMLVRSGYRLARVENGDATWASLRRARPTVLIADMCHPGIPTLDLCRQIRADAALRSLPIVVWSSFFPPRWELTCRELHLFSRFKPLLKSELIALIERAIANTH